jgi:putative ABC transport system substrate-binding protein
MNRREFLLLLGSAMAVVRPLLAQQKAMPVIGYFAFGTADTAAPLVAAFRQGLSETGYLDGKNVTIEIRAAGGDYGRLLALAADLVARKVDLIAALGGLPAAIAAKNATSTIPIVFAVGVDAVGSGLVASLARPGGNLTGVSDLTGELMPKRLELMSELLPQAGAIGLLVNPNNPIAERTVSVAQEAARAKGVQIEILKAGSENEADTALATLVQRHPGAGLVQGTLLFGRGPDWLVALAARHAVPAIYFSRGYVADGGLISYGPSFPDVARRVGIYAAKILKGAKPAELPVEQPTRFELIVNLKTAQTLGLTIPPSILARADEVVE